MSNDLDMDEKSSMSELRVRIVTVDHYMTMPARGYDELYAEFNGCEIVRVPVIRVFGVTEKGHRVCVHVHGVYPYICIPFEAEKHIDRHSFLKKLSLDLDDKLMANRDRRGPSNYQVHRIEVVKRIPFYGYHAVEEPFAKIQFYNPFMAKKSVDILTSGIINNQEYQPYMAHIPYILQVCFSKTANVTNIDPLQFFIDYNLNGMNFLRLSNVIHRVSEPDRGDCTQRQELFKITSCDIEVDCKAADILNVHEESINSGLELIWEEERERCRRAGKSSQVTPPSSQEIREADHHFFNEAKFQRLIDEAIAKISSDTPSQDLRSSTRKLENQNEQANQSKGKEDESSDDEADDDRVTLEMSQLLREAVNISDIEEEDDNDNAEQPVTKNDPVPSTSKATCDQSEVHDEASNDNSDSAKALEEFNRLYNEKRRGFENSDDDVWRWVTEFDADLGQMVTKCYCASDQCCDICCDRFSNECECNCEPGTCHKDTEKDSTIPQLDGAYDSDSSVEELPLQSSSQPALKRVKRVIHNHTVLIDASIPLSEVIKMRKTCVYLPKLSASEIEKYKRKPVVSSNEPKNLVVDITMGDEETLPAEDILTQQQPAPPNEQPADLNDCVEIVDEQIMQVEPDSSSAATKATTEVEKSSQENNANDDADDVSSTGIYSFYEYGINSSQEFGDTFEFSSQSMVGSPGPESLPSSQPRNSQSSSPGLLRFSQENNDSSSAKKRPRHSTQTSVRRSARSKGLSRKQLSLENISMIESGSQPLTTIREEDSTKFPNDSSATETIEEGYVKVLHFSRTKTTTTIEKIESLATSRFEPLEYKKRLRDPCSNDSIIEGPTQSQPFKFVVDSLGESITEEVRHCSPHEFQKINIMSMEMHIDTRGELRPDPAHDAIRAIFYSFYCDDKAATDRFDGNVKLKSGMVITKSNESLNDAKQRRNILARSGFLPTIDEFSTTLAEDECDLIMKFIEVVRQYDPEIVLGYEIEMLSWGYLVERASKLNMKVTTGLSRLLDENLWTVHEEKPEHLHLPGRVVLNLWRILRKEITLNIYSYENCHYHVLHERIPTYSYQQLTDWYNNFEHERWRVYKHFIMRVRGSLLMLNTLGIIPKTSTLARVYGIQFEEVLTRGSQFRVESMLLRYLKKFNYIPVSPTPRQRGMQCQPEWIPLVMEPQSNFYKDPIVVLDFQSLYPSMIIAYNMCYSTCLGRVSNFKEDVPFKFGCLKYCLPKTLLKQHRDNIFVSTNGCAFLKSSVRKGILPQMLTEILDTRIIVKNAMKENNRSPNKSRSLARLLDARQLACKLLANVTYGYTAANFSGRMPCIDIADAIVSKGRETLERTIQLINEDPEWGGRVVYGDTDSVFVLFEGCSREEAFRRGREIAQKVTQLNPRPVKLKFEKVYQPCVLQSKKRYVGYAYEDERQTEPIFDAKGIETVRRDGCPAVTKILEKSIRIFFDSNGTKTAEVKNYVCRQFQKIINNRISTMQNFIFARQYRGQESYSSRACVPALEITRKLLAQDPRSEPRIKERVPYVIVAGSPNQPVFQLVRQPIELFQDPSLRLNAVYYIERVIAPPLNRIFLMVGEDVLKWYRQMPRKLSVQRSHYLYAKQHQQPKRKQQTTISQYFPSGNCPVCAQKSQTGDICRRCLAEPQTAIRLLEQQRAIEAKITTIRETCRSCMGSRQVFNVQDVCSSIDCPVLFRLAQAKLETSKLPYIKSLMDKLVL